MSRRMSITLATAAAAFALVSVLGWRIWQIATHPLSRKMSPRMSPRRRPR